MSYSDNVCLTEEEREEETTATVERVMLLEDVPLTPSIVDDLCQICGQLLVDEDMHACLNAVPSSLITLQDPRLGAVVADHFVLEEYICTSDTSFVYKARHQLLNTHFAIKISSEVAEPDSFSVLRTNRAALIAMRLDHPNVVRTVSFKHEKHENALLVMEWANGIPLSQLILKEAPLTPLRVVNLLEGICDALRYAHSQGVNHINLKPSGIVVAEINGVEQARLLDFGLMKMLKPHTTNAAINNQHLRYASPEEWAGQPVDQKSMVYSIGLMMHVMLAGNAEEFEISPPTKNGFSVPALVKVRPDLKEASALDHIIAKCVDSKPARRYQNMDELGVALANLRVELDRMHRAELILSRQIGPEEVTKGNKFWMILALVALILMVAVFSAHGSLPVR